MNKGKSLEEILKVLEISDSTYNRWCSQYGAMLVDEAKLLKMLEVDNKRSR